MIMIIIIIIIIIITILIKHFKMFEASGLPSGKQCPVSNPTGGGNQLMPVLHFITLSL